MAAKKKHVETDTPETPALPRPTLTVVEVPKDAITGSTAKEYKPRLSEEEEARLFDQRRDLIEQAHKIRAELADEFGWAADALDIALGGPLPSIPPKRD